MGYDCNKKSNFLLFSWLKRETVALDEQWFRQKRPRVVQRFSGKYSTVREFCFNGKLRRIVLKAKIKLF